MSPQAVLLILVSFASIIMNFVIFLLQWKFKLETPTDHIVKNLCISDFGTGVTFVWSLLATNGDLSGNPNICAAQSFMLNFFITTTSALITTMAYYRWSIVVNEHKPTIKQTYIRIFICWCIGTLFASLAEGWQLYVVYPSEIYCTGELHFRTWQSGLYIVLGMLLLSGCTALIFYFYFTIYKSFMAVHSLVSNEGAQNAQLEPERRLFKICVAIAVNYYVWFTPLLIQFIWSFAVGSSNGVHSAFNALVVICWVCNSASNPFLYLTFMKGYKQALKALLKGESLKKQSSGSHGGTTSVQSLPTAGTSV